MRQGVVHAIGHLNNRQDPIKLGQVSEQDPVVTFLKVAQNIDIDDRGVATTRDGQEERYLGAASSLWVHPQDDTIAYFLEKESVTIYTEQLEDTGFDLPLFSVWSASSGTWSISGGKAILSAGSAFFYLFQIPPVAFVAGTEYRYTIVIDATNEGVSLEVKQGTRVDIVGTGTHTGTIVAGSGSNTIRVYPLSATATATIDSLSLELVEEVDGDAVLKQFNTDFTATTIATMNSDNDISFAAINGLVFLSNGVDIGYIENGAFVPFSQTLLRDELAMPAGEYIAYLDNEGVLLVASGNTVYRSKPWNPQVRDARFSEFPMNGKVRMLATVEDGWFVATEKNVSFAQMDGEDGYRFRHITDSVPPDGAFYKEFHFDEDKGKDSQMRVIWASSDGFIEGTSGGGYENHSYPNVALPEGNKGKVFNRNANGTNQYLAVIFNPEDDNNYVAPTLLKNSITP